MSSLLNKSINKERRTGISRKQMLRLGSYLKLLREDLAMSLRTAAKLGSISPAHLSKIENGETFSSIGIDVLLRLSLIYNIPLSSIFEEAGLVVSNNNLPELAAYLRNKYNLPAQAIRDLETAKEIVDRKYGRRGTQNSQSSLF